MLAALQTGKWQENLFDYSRGRSENKFQHSTQSRAVLDVHRCQVKRRSALDIKGKPAKQFNGKVIWEICWIHRAMCAIDQQSNGGEI
jgi:hypothetical protein